MLGQRLQPRREDVGRDAAHRLLQLVEALGPVEQRRDREQGPAVADPFQRVGQRGDRRHGSDTVTCMLQVTDVQEVIQRSPSASARPSPGSSAGRGRGRREPHPHQRARAARAGARICARRRDSSTARVDGVDRGRRRRRPRRRHGRHRAGDPPRDPDAADLEIGTPVFAARRSRRARPARHARHVASATRPSAAARRASPAPSSTPRRCPAARPAARSSTPRAACSASTPSRLEGGFILAAARRRRHARARRRAQPGQGAGAPAARARAGPPAQPRRRPRGARGPGRQPGGGGRHRAAATC